MRLTRPDSRLYMTADQLRQVASEVSALPSLLADASVGDLRKFLDHRYGDDLLADLTAAQPALSELTEKETLSAYRALGVHGMTVWFREPFGLRALKQIVLPNLSARSPIHIASIGCSEGEEVYSIVLDNWESRAALKVSGFDICPSRIHRARNPEWRMRQSPDPAWSLRNGFECEVDIPEQVWNETLQFKPYRENDLQVTPSQPLREAVTFDVHDILLQPLPEPVDVIMLKNVFCHYEALGRNEIVNNIMLSLRPGGYFIADAHCSLSQAAKNIAELKGWYNALGSSDFERQSLSIWYAWCSKYMDDTAALYVFRKR